jgi:hypothetical protein
MKSKVISIVFIAFGVAFAMLYGCKHDPYWGSGSVVIPPTPPPSTTCSPDTVYFQNDVLPLFQSNCAKSGCHDVATAREGVVMVSYQSVMSSGIVPYNTGASRVYQSMTGGGGGGLKEDDIMPPPPNPPMTSAQLQLIAKWINQGALNTLCESAGCDSTNVTYTTSLVPILQTFCVGCHSSSNPSYNINLTTYNGVVAVANTGQLMGSIRQQQGYFPMPKGGSQLSTCDIALFQIWINNGKPNK